MAQKLLPRCSQHLIILLASVEFANDSPQNNSLGMLSEESGELWAASMFVLWKAVSVTSQSCCLTSGNLITIKPWWLWLGSVEMAEPFPCLSQFFLFFWHYFSFACGFSWLNMTTNKQTNT